MSVEAHPLELAVALGLIAPHALECGEAGEPSDEDRARAEADFAELCARLDDEA